MVDSEASVPTHIGFILDGNRRWARKHGLPVYEGHLAGYNALKEVIRATADSGVKYISLYAFSTENWKRKEDEVNKLMKFAMRLFKNDLQELLDNDTRLLVLGSKKGLPNGMAEAIEEAEQKTAHCQKATIGLCFNYGGQQEIAEAVQKAAKAGVNAEEITEEDIAQHLYAPEIPPVDLVVRTSGEQRISNFMLWRIAYSEFLFLDKYWPEMTPDDVAGIIDEYQKRSRRFGG